MAEVVEVPSSDRDWGFEPGDAITRDLTAVKLLGGGRRYEAYLAYDSRLLAMVVVKLVRPTRVGEAKVLDGLAEEFAALTALNHPSIARGYDLVLDGRPHLTLEHIEGPRLSTLVRRFGRVDLEQLLPLAVQVSSALHYMHSRGMVHLDVKPQNIIMGAPPRLIDLSVAMPVSEARYLRVAVGTDAYMAPEQADPQSGVEIGAPADVWGLGVSLYEAALGQLPFPRDPDEPHPQLRMAPAPVDTTIPRDLAAVIDATLSRDPAARPAPAEIVEVLEPMTALPKKLVLGGMRPRWR